MNFELHSEYKPTGDQPQAIEKLVEGFKAGKLALKWAFEHPQVLAVEAESDPDNAASQRVLEKCGFLATGAIGEEGPRFIVYKENNKQ